MSYTGLHECYLSKQPRLWQSDEPLHQCSEIGCPGHGLSARARRMEMVPTVVRCLQWVGLL